MASRFVSLAIRPQLRPVSGFGFGPGLRFASTSELPSAASSAASAAASTASSTVKKTARTGRRLVKTAIAVTVIGTGLYYATDTRASIHKYIAVPLARLAFPDAEDSHHAAVDAIRSLYQLGLHPRERPDLGPASASLDVPIFQGQTLSNPIGISAGLDKHGEIPDPLFELGASVVEIGGITPEPQEGNLRPRVFRLPSQQAAINRYGLNSEGADAVAARLTDRVRQFAAQQLGWTGPDAVQAVLDGHAGVPPGSLRQGKILGIQIAKNKATPESDIAAVCQDYVTCVNKLGPFADVIVVNVSSPNTPGLRTLQNAGPLTELLSAVVSAAQAVPRAKKPAVMVKVSPDEDSPDQIAGVCDAIYLARVDGVIVGNTTKGRPVSDTISARDCATLSETGGYSGPLMFPQTVSLVRKYRTALHATPGRLAATQAEADGKSSKSDPSPFVQDEKVIFASGGISTGADALAVLNAGASVAMMYTALTMNGLGHVTAVKKQIRDAIAPKATDKTSERPDTV